MCQATDLLRQVLPAKDERPLLFAGHSGGVAVAAQLATTYLNAGYRVERLWAFMGVADAQQASHCFPKRSGFSRMLVALQVPDTRLRVELMVANGDM